MSTKISFGPTPPEERIVVIDILRGLALFGILLANMVHFSTPIIYLQLTDIELWQTPWDKWVQAGLTIFVEGKFYTLFSFLFGWGFVFFMERAREKGKHPRLLYSRRLIGLFFFGLIHAFFIWYGDILLLYAISGFILLLFYQRKPGTLLVWAAIFLFLSILPILLLVAVATHGLAEGEKLEWIEYNQVFMEEMKMKAVEAYQAYAHGTLADMIKQRVLDVQFMLSYAPFTIPMILPMFLLGAYVAKKRLFQEADKHLPVIKLVWWLGLVLGLSLNILKYISLQQMEVAFPTSYDLLAQVGMAIGDPMLSIFYITSILLLTQEEKWRNRFSHLVPAGRLALTNYIGQSILCTSIFYNYGLGLYGQVGALLSVFLAVVIFLIQLWFSKFWLARFSFGPLEWLWRLLTYGRLTHT